MESSLNGNVCNAMASGAKHGKVLLCNHSKRREESRKSSLSQTVEVKDRINTETERLHKLCMSLILNDKYCRPSRTIPYIYRYAAEVFAKQWI